MEPHAPEPDSRIDPLGFALAPVQFLLSPPPGINFGVDTSANPDVEALPPEDTEELLEALELELPDGVEAFRAATAAQDPSVRRRLAMAVEHLDQTLPHLVRLAMESFAEEAFDQAVRLGKFVGRIGAVLGDVERAVTGYWFAGRASWRLQRARQSVDLLKAATDLGDHALIPPTFLAAAHDLLGLALAQVQRFPDALAHFRTSARLEKDPVQRLLVEMNRVTVLANAGYVDEAAERAASVRLRSMTLPLPDLERGRVLDSVGDVLRQVGQGRGALAAYEAAARALTGAPTRDRVINLLSRSACSGELGDLGQQGRLYEEAWRVAQEAARSSIERDLVSYRDGLRAHARRSLPAEHEGLKAFRQALNLRDQGDLRGVIDAYRYVRQVASENGDLGLALRAQLNEAAISLDLGQLDDAIALAQEAGDVARQEGLALFEGWGAQLVVSAICQGGDAGSSVDAVLLGARAEQLIEVTAAQLATKSPENPGLAFTMPTDSGALNNELSILAEHAHADELSVTQLRRAVELGRRAGNIEGEALRSANLMRRLAQLAEAPEDRSRLRTRLLELLPRLSVRTTLAVRLLLLDFGGRSGGLEPDADARLIELQALIGLVERLRAEAAPGPARAHVDSGTGVYPRLVDALSDAGRHEQAWESLQQMRARRLLEVLDAQRDRTKHQKGGPDDRRGYEPPGLTEACALLAAVGPRTTLVDIRIVDDGLEAYLVNQEGVRHLGVAGPAESLFAASWGDPGRRAVDLCTLARTDLLLGRLAAAISAATAGDDLLISVDDALSNVPFHLVPVAGRPWGEAQLLGRLPAIGLLRYSRRWGAGEVGAVVAGDSDGGLPGAAAECRDVAELLGTTPLLGDACSAAGLAQALTGRSHWVVHLAVHGFADPRRGGSASLLLGRDGAPTWIPFEALASIPWQARLVTFSGCSTAVGGPRHGQGLYGLTETAMSGGAGSVLASLWPVDDRGTRTFMAAFYADLKQQAVAGDVDLRMALRAAGRVWAEAVPAQGDATAGDARVSVCTRYLRDLPPDQAASTLR